MKRTIGITLGAVTLQLALVALTKGRLPARVATHFALDGTPNGWMSRDSHALFFTVFALVLNLALLALTLAIERSRSLRWVNIPWRDYWTATPERVAEALRRALRLLRGTIVFVNAVLLGAQLVILSQNGALGSPSLPAGDFFWVVMAAVAVFLAAAILPFRPERA